MSQNAKTLRRATGVFLVLLLVLAPMTSGAVVAADGSASGGAASLSAPGGYRSVADTSTYALTNHTNVWEYAPLPLRADRSAADHSASGPGIYVTKQGSSLRTSLNKPIAFYNASSTVPETFVPQRGGATYSQFDGERAQVVALRLRKGSDAPTTVSALRSFVGNDSNAAATMVANRTFDFSKNSQGNFQDTFGFDPSRGGEYVLMLATPGGNSTGYTVTNGHLSTTGSVTVLGFDTVMVQDHRSTVTPQSDAATGGNVTFDVNANTGPAPNTSQAVVLYDNETLYKSSSTVTLRHVTANGNVSANVTSGIRSVNGDFHTTGNPSVYGVNASDRRVSYPVTPQGLLDFLRSRHRFGSAVSVTNASDAAVLNATGTVRRMDASGTLNVSVPSDWPAGDYRWIHVSTTADGANVSSSQGSLSLARGIDLSVHANRTGAKPGAPVAFTVTRADTGAPVDATLAIDGSTYATNANGTVVHAFSSVGDHTVTATKAGNASVRYRSASLTFPVTASNVVVSNVSAPHTVTANATFDVNATVQNVGNVAGTRTLNFTVDGAVVANRTVSLAPNATRTVTFTYTFRHGERGPHTVGVSGRTATTKVVEPATYNASDLSVTPSQVLANATLSASARVTNVGDLNGTGTVPLVVDGTRVANATVSLAPGASTRVSFNTTLSSSGRHTVGIDDAGPRNVTVLAPAHMTYSGLRLAKSTINAGASATARVNVTNTGDVSGIYVATLRANGTRIGRTSGILRSNRSETLRFDHRFTNAGADALSVNGLAPVTLHVARTDAVPPSVVLTKPSTGTVRYGRPLSFRVRDSSGVARVNVSATAGGSWNPSVETTTTNQHGSKGTNVTVPTRGWPEGAARVNVTATDTSGNAVTRTYRFDLASPPHITSVSPRDGSNGTVHAAFTYADDANGNNESGIDASTATLRVDGQRHTVNATATTATATLNLSSGTHRLTASVADRAGHASTQTWTVTVDAGPPTVGIQPLRSRTTVTSSRSFVGRVTAKDSNLANATVTIENATGAVVHREDVTRRAHLTGGHVVVRWNGRDATGRRVPDGNYTATVTASDAYGHTASASANVTVDAHGPRVRSATLDGVRHARLNGSDVRGGTLSAHATFAHPASVTRATYVLRQPGSGIAVSKTVTSDVANASFPASRFRADGNYTLRVLATDRAFNTRTTTTNATVRVDTTPPSLAATITTNAATHTGTVSVSALSGGLDVSTLNGTVRHAGHTTDLSFGGTHPQNATFDASASGVYNVSVRGRDAAGNVGRANASASVHTVKNGQRNVTVYLADSGVAVHLHLAHSVSNGFYTMSSGALPGRALPANASSLGSLAGQVSSALDANITGNSTLGFPVHGRPNPKTHPIQYYNTSQGRWVSLDTHYTQNYTVRDGNGTVVNGHYNGPGRGYVVANISHFTTYAGMAQDNRGPAIAFERGNRTLPASATHAWVNASVTDASGVQNVTVTRRNGTGSPTDVTDDATVTPTSGASQHNDTVAYDVTGLRPGVTYAVTVGANDTKTNHNASTVTLSVRNDTAKPNVTVTSPANGTLPATARRVTLNATYGDGGSGVARVNASVDGQNETLNALDAANHTLALATNTTALGAGAHTFEVAVTDRAGNTRTVKRTVTVPGPSVNVTSPVDGRTYANTTTSVPVTATVNDPAATISSASVVVDGVDKSAANVTYAGTTATVESTVDVSAGHSHTVNVSVRDTRGQTNTTRTAFSVAPDTRAPTVTITPANGTTLSNATTRVNATVAYRDDVASSIAPSEVTVLYDGSPIKQSANVTNVAANGSATTFEVTGLTPGSEHFLSGNVSDGDGNARSANATFDVAGVQTTANLTVLPNVSVTPRHVGVGRSVTVTATVFNHGGTRGTRTIDLTRDGTTVNSTPVTLNASERRHVTFHPTFPTAGNHALRVGGVDAGTVNVTADYTLSGSLNATNVTTNGTVAVTVDGTNRVSKRQTVPVSVTEPDGSMTVHTALVLPPGGSNATTVTLRGFSAGHHGVRVNGVRVGTLNVTNATSNNNGGGNNNRRSSHHHHHGGGGGGGFTGGSTSSPVTVTRTTSGNGTVHVDLSNVHSGETFHVAANASGSNPNASLSSLDLDLNGTSSSTLDFNANPGRTPALRVGHAISYFNISHHVPERDIGSVTFTFTVTASELAKRGLSRGQVGLYRYHNGSWVSLHTNFVSEENGVLTYRATSPGLSVYAVGSSPASISVTDASVNATGVSAGDAVSVSATVTNDGGTAGNATIPLVVDGSTVDSTTVQVAANASTTTSFTYTFSSTGGHDVSVGNASAGTVTVAAANGGGSNGTSSNGGSANNGGSNNGNGGTGTTTPPKSKGGFPVGPAIAVIVVLAAILAGLYVYRERQR